MIDAHSVKRSSVKILKAFFLKPLTELSVPPVPKIVSKVIERPKQMYL
jgi:hypothetical protein